MRTIDKFANISVDLDPIGLIRRGEMGGYFCTPQNAITFAHTGIDGIHFCIIPEENDPELKHSPVYIINPMDSFRLVEIVANDFYDFVSLVVVLKGASTLDWIDWYEKEKFMESIKQEHSNPYYDTPEVKSAITALSDAFASTLFIKNIDDAYDSVKQLRAKTDLTEIQYSKEYYATLGLILDGEAMGGDV